MPPLWIGIAGFVSAIAASLIARTAISLGIGVVSYIGFGFVLDYIFDSITSAFNGLPVVALQFASLLKLDVAVNIIMGSVNARFGLVSLNGIVSRFQINPDAYGGSSST